MFSNITLFDAESLIALLLRFGFNLLITGIVIFCLYYRKTQRRDFLFTFIMVSTTIFLMIFLLDNIKIQMGFAMGLFAIFGILRYRTETLPVREMTYLFAIIGISVINALSNHKVSIVELVVTNILFLIVLWVLETTRIIKHTSTKLIIYERIDLIKASRSQEMLADLRERTGLNIERFEIGQIDFLKDTAFVKVYYTNHNSNGKASVNTADNIVAPKEHITDN